MLGSLSGKEMLRTSEAAGFEPVRKSMSVVVIIVDAATKPRGEGARGVYEEKVKSARVEGVAVVVTLASGKLCIRLDGGR